MVNSQSPQKSRLSVAAARLAAVALVLAAGIAPMLTSSDGASAAEPTLNKSLAGTQAARNPDGTFPSGSIVTYEVSIGCNAQGQGDNCDTFELHDLTPNFTDINGAPAIYEFVSASPAGAGPSIAVNSDDPANIVITFPDGFPGGSSINIQLSFLIPPGVTPDNTVSVNTALFGEFVDGQPTANVVTDTQEITSRAKTGFEVTKTGPTQVNINEPVAFTVALCGDAPDDPYFGPLVGTVENATLTEQIPDGFVVVDAGGGTDNGDGTVTWLLGDLALGVDQCEERQIVLQYPSAEPLTEPIETTNVVVAAGTFPPDVEPPGPGELPIVVLAAGTGQPLVVKGIGRYYVDLDRTDGPNGTDDDDSYTYWSLQSMNDGNGTIMDAVLNDPLPSRFVATRIETGTWPAGPTGPNDDGQVEYVVTFQNGTSTSVFADGTTDISIPVTQPSANPAVDLTINWGDLPPGWSQNEGVDRTQMFGYFIDPGRDGGDPINFDATPFFPVRNRVVLSGMVADPQTGELAPAEDVDNATINIESPQPHIAVYKDVTPTGNAFGNGVFPSNDFTTTVLTWKIELENHRSGTDPLRDPVVLDLLPTLEQNVLGEGGLSAPYDFTVAAPAAVTCPTAPTSTAPVPNAATGLTDTVLRFECAGELPRNSRIVYTFKTDVLAGTPPQTINNDMFGTTNALTDDGEGQWFSVWDGGEAFGFWQEDADDLDGDGDTADRIRRQTAQIPVLDFVFLQSEKLVRGGVNATCAGGAFPPAGEMNDTFGIERCTRPGDIVDYELSVQNAGSVDATNLLLIDLFPRVGDTSVVPNQNTGSVVARNSQFDTNLVAPITADDPNVVIEYTTELQPCRYDDFYPNNAGAAEVPGCTSANWTTTPPSPISLATGMRITYIDQGTGEPGVLELGDTFALMIPMRASVAAVPDQIATNSFGWSAKSTGSDTVNTAQPPPVDIAVAELGGFQLGDLVWFDLDANGVQDEAPLVGAPRVPIALFEDTDGDGVLTAADTFLQETVSDAAGGVEGEYLFSELPAGDYLVAFAPPGTFAVSPPFEGGDTGVDSNGTLDVGFPTSLWDPAAVNGPLYSNVYVSDLVTLGPDDLTIDLGLWQPDPAIDIEKATNAADVDAPTPDEDADAPTGPYIPAGEDVTWSYIVTNTGNMALVDVIVMDDSGTPGDTADDLSTADGTITCPVTELALGESMTCTSTTPTPAIVGQYTNLSGVVGTPELPELPGDPDGDAYADLLTVGGVPFVDANGEVIDVMDSDPSNYFGALAAVDIEKSTNDIPADEFGGQVAGPVLQVGDAVTWTYVVTIPDTANVALADIVLVDDAGTSADTSDDLTSANGDFTFVGGDTDGDGLLDLDEAWTYTASAPEGAVAGIYENLVDVVGTPVTPDGTPIENPDGTPMEQPTDDDPSHYYGQVNPAIDIEKSTNGIPADLPGTDPAGPQLEVGDTVTWTYVITNTGDVDLLVEGLTDDKEGTITACVQDVVGAVFPVTLAPGEWATCSVTGLAVLGQYVNNADVIGTPVDAEGQPITENPSPNGPIPIEPPTDEDPSHYTATGTAAVDIEKATNGDDADVVTGPTIVLGDLVTWTYVVTNTGTLPLIDLEVTDDKLGSICTIDLMLPGESDTCEISGPAESVGQYENLGTVVGTPATPIDPDGDPDDPSNYEPVPDIPPVDDEDPSHYIGVEASIDIEKATNGVDADAPGSGPLINQGGLVTWTYVVRNTGSAPLIDVKVTDDKEGEICTISLLLPGASSTCTATGVAGSTAYDNVSTVTGTPAAPVDPDGNPNDPDNYEPVNAPPVTDTDPSNYSVPPPLPPKLPETGSNVVLMVRIALLAVAAGMGLMVLGVRRRRAHAVD